MKKIIFSFISVAFVFWLLSFVSYQPNRPNYLAKAAMTQDVTTSGTVKSYSGITITSGQSIDFGSIYPGLDSCNTSGTIASVTTNSANGYTIGLHDGSNTLSAMSGTLSTIPDMATGTLAVPLVWATGETTGVGVSLWTGTSALGGNWVTGTTSACAYGQKFGAVPATTTVARTKTGYSAGPDTTGWGWRVNVDNAQATGVYTGVVTLTLTEVLS